MQGRGLRENIPKKSIHLRAFKGLKFVFCFSVFIEKRVHFFYIWFIILGLVLVLICKFIISHNNFE